MLGPADSYSADVKMWLDCGTHGHVELSRITPTKVIARRRCEIPPCYAELVVVVDGETMRRPVHIPAGFTNSRLALALPVDHVAPF
jgi:hypothetical protein